MDARRRVSASSFVPAASSQADADWAQKELSSYFREHPALLQKQLDKMLGWLRASGSGGNGDMATFIANMDAMIDEVNAAIDNERRNVEGRSGRLKDFPEVTNDFLHFFLDGVLESVENEQAAGKLASPAGAMPPRPRAGAPVRFASATGRMQR